MAFGIDSNAGNLHTKIRLDREKRMDYEFEVIAMDNGPIKLAGSANVRVIVDDVNDNFPKFIYPSQENQSHTYSIHNVKVTPMFSIVYLNRLQVTNITIFGHLFSVQENIILFFLNKEFTKLLLHFLNNLNFNELSSSDHI